MSANNDKKLRGRIVTVLAERKMRAPSGAIPGPKLKDEVEGLMPMGMGFDDDDHALRLMREVEGWGFATEELVQRRAGQLFNLNFVIFEITPAGMDLHLGNCKPHPMIDNGFRLED